MQIGSRYVISEGGKVVQVSKQTKYAMKRAEMLAIAYSQEFQEFQEWWPKLTWEEKVAEAEEKGVTWNRHDDAKVDNIRCSVAMRKKLGIKKWKPMYKTGRAREDLWKKGIRAE
jgi:hypothetical protein